MNSIDIANGIIFKEMKISKDSFDERIICQKKIYLLQSLGTDLGYSYNWYLKGPYSPALANYVYSNIELLVNTNFDSYTIAKKAKDNIDRVNELQDEKPDDFTMASWYELLASLLYIEKNRESWKIGSENSELFDALIKHKPQFSVNQCERAYAVLENKGFIYGENKICQVAN